MSVPPKTVVLVGPDVQRNRGGIAQFTSRLSGALSDRHDVEFFSWSELYPRILISRSAPRSGSMPHSIPSCPELAFSRPWTWRKCVDRIAAVNPDTVIFTWTHPVHAPIFSSMLRRLRKLVRSEIILVCHNVLPHERFPGAAALTRRCFEYFDRIVVHSRHDALRLEQLFIGVPVTLAFMPVFDFFESPVPVSRSVRPPRILFFGSIRPHKGLDLLLRSIPLVKNVIPDLQLRIAGEEFFSRRSPLRFFLGGRGSSPLELIEALDLESTVELDIRYIPDRDVPSIFSGVDAVVFPFRAANQSGSLSLAFTFGIPVVAPNVGFFPEVIAPNINGILVTPNSPASLAEGIIRAISRKMPESWVHSHAEDYSWERYCDVVLESVSVEIGQSVNG